MSTAAFVSRATSARNAHFFRLLSTRCMRKSGLPASRIATTSPGKPAPDPRSSQSRAFGARARSWAESAKCRDQRAGRVEASHQVGAGLPMGQQFGVAGQPVDCFTWNFKGFREILRSTDGRRGLIARHLPSPSWLRRSWPRALFQVSEEQHERGRRHAVEPRRLAETCGAMALELLAKLGREARERGEGEAFRNGDALVLAEGCDVELLPLDVDGVARIDASCSAMSGSSLPISGQIDASRATSTSG